MTTAAARSALALEPAPFHEDVAEGPSGGAAHWLTCADGLRIRAAHWPCDGAKGTILMFPGRTEYIEKYGRTAAEFAERGYGMAAIDWRGQGLSTRMADDRGLGHVGRFSDFQHDVAAFVDYARACNLPEPFYLIAHSMGGCIGLRALHNGLPVKAVMFSAPMWGIVMSPAVRPAAWVMSTLASRFGLGTRVSPGQTTDNYVGKVLFPDNLLTTDDAMFDYMERQLTAHPDLGLGGPSLNWLNEALREMYTLSTMQSPAYPTLTFLGTEEKIVDADRIKTRMARWADGELVTLEGAKHEVLMETPVTRSSVIDRTVSHFDKHN